MRVTLYPTVLAACERLVDAVVSRKLLTKCHRVGSKLARDARMLRQHFERRPSVWTGDENHLGDRLALRDVDGLASGGLPKHEIDLMGIPVRLHDAGEHREAR